MAAPDQIPGKIVVIGGGISGLACAWRLRRLGLPVLLIERGARFGGVIDTVEKDGFRFDIGPQSFLATPPIAAWIEELGLTGDLLRANPRAPRYILHGGRLVRAPFGPGDLLRTPLVGWRTKLRLATEPFHRTRPPEGDESIAAFVRRKFGDDLLNNLVAPFVSGVYAGDAEKLSLPSAFPSVRGFEEQSGSVIRGAIQSMRKRPASGKREPRAPLCNFRNGLVTLIDAVAAGLGDAAAHGAEVTAIRRQAALSPSPSPAFDVAYNQGGAARALAASAVVVAAPTAQAADLLASIEPRFGVVLRQIEYAGVAQVATAYRMSQLNPKHPAASGTGFGFLVPRTAGLRLLGTVWNSFLFPGRVPDVPGDASVEGAQDTPGKGAKETTVNFTTFIGGATDPGLIDLADDEIAAIVCRELAGVLGIDGPPVALHLARWKRAIPQYNLGHARIVAELNQLCAQTPGIFLTGNYFGGPSLGACVEQANATAEAVARYLGAQT